MGNGNAYLIMWKHIFGYGNTRFCLCQDTGTMNRPLRLAGCFATHFVCVRNVIAIRQQCFGRPFAAVGADLSCPHIWMYPRNDERKCACVDVEIRVRWNEYTYLMTWIYVFDNVRIRARWIGPLRLTGCSLRISRIVRWHFAECSPRNRKPFITYFVCVRCAFVGWIWCICKIKNLEKNLTYQFFCLSLPYIRISLLRLFAVQ